VRLGSWPVVAFVDYRLVLNILCMHCEAIHRHQQNRDYAQSEMCGLEGVESVLAKLCTRSKVADK
jgi:hypothetical protein